MLEILRSCNPFEQGETEAQDQLQQLLEQANELMKLPQHDALAQSGTEQNKSQNMEAELEQLRAQNAFLQQKLEQATSYSNFRNYFQLRSLDPNVEQT